MDTRESLRRMRNLKRGVIENFDNKTNTDNKKKDLSVRDMLKITRKLTEADMKQVDANNDGDVDANFIDTSVDSKKTAFDQKVEEEKFREAIKNFNVEAHFEPIEILDYSVVWNGTIDNQLQWSFLVTPDESVNGVKFNYSENFDENEPDNEELVKTISSYYDDFYKYWRDNELEK
jgi:hypothetical protein